ncbi:MAG TPA: hypothetical protein VGM52_04045 [Herbaspirillum sp.]|jgi:two-component system osmolarity sensor histidine kinase EnvZ
MAWRTPICHWPDTVPVEGPLELATVTEAFNRMMQALTDMEATRPEMLAGISHDLIVKPPVQGK